MIAAKKPNAARNIAATEIDEGPDPEQAQRHDRLRDARLDPDEDDAEHEADQDQAADRGIGPFAGLLVGEADEERRDGQGEDGRAEVVDVARRVRPADGRQEAPQDDTSETRPIGMLTKKIQCQPTVSVMNPPMAGPMSDDSAEDRPEEAQVLAALGRRVEVGDDREGDREDGAAAEALEAAEQDELPHLLAEAGTGPSRSGTG